MMDKQAETAPVKSAVSGAPRGTKIILALSLAFNLAVAGFVVGHSLDADGRDEGRMSRDMGFGSFTQALSNEDRRALAKSMFAAAPQMRDARSRMQADLAQITAALTADPFDVSALDSALDAQRSRATEFFGLAQSVMRDYLVAMTPEARRAFAERLQSGMRHDKK